MKKLIILLSLFCSHLAHGQMHTLDSQLKDLNYVLNKQTTLESKIAFLIVRIQNFKVSASDKGAKFSALSSLFEITLNTCRTSTTDDEKKEDCIVKVADQIAKREWYPGFIFRSCKNNIVYKNYKTGSSIPCFVKALEYLKADRPDQKVGGLASYEAGLINHACTAFEGWRNKYLCFTNSFENKTILPAISKIHDDCGYYDVGLYMTDPIMTDDEATQYATCYTSRLDDLDPNSRKAGGQSRRAK